MVTRFRGQDKSSQDAGGRCPTNRTHNNRDVSPVALRSARGCGTFYLADSPQNDLLASFANQCDAGAASRARSALAHSRPESVNPRSFSNGRVDVEAPN